MSDEHSIPQGGDPTAGQVPGDAVPLNASAQRIGEAERTLAAAAEAAATAEQRAEAEIRALETDLERWRTESDRVRKELELRHEEELTAERAAKDRAIAAAEERLGEIETHTDAAEDRIAAAERRAEQAEKAVALESARAREGAAAWLRERIDSIRREGGDK
jgi:colicin import membrane protein